MTLLSDADDLTKRLRRKPGKTILFLVGAGIVAGAGAWATSYLGERGRRAAGDDGKQAERAPAGFPLKFSAAESARQRPVSQLFAIEQVTLATSEDRNRLDLSLRNRGDESAVVTQLFVDAHFEHPGCAAFSAIPHTIDIVEMEALVSLVRGSFRVDPDKNFKYPLSGEFSDATCQQRLRLQMVTAVQLAGKSVSTVRIGIPRRINVWPTENGKQGAPRQLPLDLRLFDSVTVRAVDSTGAVAGRAVTLPLRSRIRDAPRGGRR